MELKRRRQNRTKAVLPVRVRGKEKSGKEFDDLAHTLDVASKGVRLGSVRCELQPGDPVTIQYRQRKMEFRVVWTKKMQGSEEYQVGLEAVTGETDAWGLVPATLKLCDVPPVSQLAGSAATV